MRPAIAHDLALLGLRLALAAVFVFHGYLAMFGGGGLDAEADYMASLGLHPGMIFAVMTGVAELGGGLLVGLGLLTRLGAIAIASVMVVAIVVATGPNGFDISADGYEYNVVLISVAVALVLIGPGRLSVDYRAGLAARVRAIVGRSRANGSRANGSTVRASDVGDVGSD